MPHVIWATENSDAEKLSADAVLRVPADALNDVQRDALGGQVRQVLQSLIDQGRRLAAQGSQMRAERKVQVGAVEVMIRFTAGVRPSLWDRLMQAVRGK